MHQRLTVFLLLLAACGPNPKAPVQVMAFVPGIDGQFTTTQVELKTVSNLLALKGSVVEFVGGNRVVIDDSDPLAAISGGLQNQSDEQRYEILVKDKGADVRGNFVDKSGVFWPADFHTWSMVTSFYNFERSYEYWLGVYSGVDPKELQKIKVMYWADFKVNSTAGQTDNAIYFSPTKSFIITPFKNDQLIPFGMNIGIIGHEMSHRVFNEKALSGKGVHPALGWNAAPFNLLKSLDEGLADYHGFGVTCTEAAGCRPNFLAASISDTTTVTNRTMSRPDLCMNDSLRNAFMTFTPGQWVSAPELYKVGTLWAGALYQAGEKTGKRGVLQRALLDAYDDQTMAKPGIKQLIDTNLNTSTLFTMEAVANSIVAHITDPELKKVTCNELTTRLQLKCGSFPCDEMPACPATSARQTFCPVLGMNP
jgi:hypothetical protein